MRLQEEGGAGRAERPEHAGAAEGEGAGVALQTQSQAPRSVCVCLCVRACVCVSVFAFGVGGVQFRCVIGAQTGSCHSISWLWRTGFAW